MTVAWLLAAATGVCACSGGGGRLVDRVGDVVVQIEDGGSGVVFDAAGLILTAAHVVGDRDRVPVLLGDGRRLEGRVLVANHGNDFAILRFDPEGALVALPIGSVDRVGGAVVLVGRDRAGALRSSTGRVVLRDVSLPSTGRTADESGDVFFDRVVVHSAPGFVGDSGGALVDETGHLVGVNLAVAGTEFTIALPVDRFDEFRSTALRFETGSDLESAGDPAARTLAALASPRRPRDRLELLDWALDGLISLAVERHPDRAAEAETLALEVAAVAASLARDDPSLTDRALVRLVWKEYLTRIDAWTR